jgi:hypothetical protein
MAGCYGNDPYDLWLESQQDAYWGCNDSDDDGRDAAMEAREDAKRDERDD